MSKNILYYPTIEFQHNDFRWLWIASLLWDKIYRIVPDNYILHEPINIQELCSTNEIGIPLSPGKYSKTVSSEFISKIDSREWQAAALEFHHDDIETYNEYSRLHKDKIDVTLQNMLLLNKDICEDEEWLYVPKEMSSLYMTYLANYIAKENKLELNTHNSELWTTSTFFLYDKQIQDGYYPGNDYINESKAVLASLFVKDLIPENILDISPKDLLKFREKRRDERVQFNKALDEFSEKITGVSDSRILKETIDEETCKVEKALKEYKKSMDILKVVKWTGYLSSLLTVAGDAFGYIDSSSNTIKALTTGGIGLGLIAGLIENKVKVKDTPYSYLSSLSEIMPDKFDNYNYRQFRQMEEFIND